MIEWFTNNAHWVFEGIGTALVGFILGWMSKGYQVKQSLTSGDHSKNIQIGRDLNK